MPSNLDASQILKYAFDDDLQALRTTVSVEAADLEVAINSVEDSIKIGDASGNYAAVNTDGSMEFRQTNSLVTAPFDYIGVTYPTSSSEAFAYKTGGSGGTLVATVTITYSDSTKVNISSVAVT